VRAFERSFQTPEELKREEIVAFVLGNLETYMKSRSMKLLQLFAEMDADGSGSLSAEELRDALERMCAPKVGADRTLPLTLPLPLTQTLGLTPSLTPKVHTNKAQELREKKALLSNAKVEPMMLSGGDTALSTTQCCAPHPPPATYPPAAGLHPIGSRQVPLTPPRCSRKSKRGRRPELGRRKPHSSKCASRQRRWRAARKPRPAHLTLVLVRSLTLGPYPPGR
jgi:hypothetical protein